MGAIKQLDIGIDMYIRGAYGRKYATKDAVLADWHAGKDFQSTSSGRYLSKRDSGTLKSAGYVALGIVLSDGGFATIEL